MDNDTLMLFGVGIGATLAAVMLIAVQLSRFVCKFQAGRRDLDASIVGLVSQLKSMQSEIGEMLDEIRRSNQLSSEELELKKAEMSGDFAIVEEELPPPGIEIPRGAKPNFPELR